MRTSLVIGCGLGVFCIALLGQETTKPAKDDKQHIVDLGSGVKLNMVRVGKGKFWMGSPADEKDREEKREDQKEVTIAEDFYLGTFEVTQEQWETVMGKGKNPSWFSRSGAGKDKVKDVPEADLKQFPVEMVSWDDIQEFLKKLNESEKTRNSGWLYRLPKEAEWEYACRGGPASNQEGKKTAPFYFAKPTSSLSSKQANFDGDIPYGGAAEGKLLGRSCKVGSYEANALGLYDMHGNAWEWCDDLFERGPYRVFRGGGWYNGGQSCRAAYRGRGSAGDRHRDLGFRLARVPVAGK